MAVLVTLNLCLFQKQERTKLYLSSRKACNIFFCKFHFTIFKYLKALLVLIQKSKKNKIRNHIRILFLRFKYMMFFFTQARSAAANGDVVEAQAQSIRARKFVIVSIVLGIIIYVFIIVIRVIFYSSYYAL